MIAVVLVVAGLIILGIDAADFTITGVALVGVAFIACGLWVGGAFSARAWFAPASHEERLSRLDEMDGLGTRRAEQAAAKREAWR